MYLVAVIVVVDVVDPCIPYVPHTAEPFAKVRHGLPG